MSQYGQNGQYGQPNSGNGAPQFRPHQRQRPMHHHGPQGLNYSALAPTPTPAHPGAPGQFRSQPSAPRPFPQHAPHQQQQQQQQQYHQPATAPVQQQHNQPQGFFPSHDYQQPAQQPAPQPTSFGYSSGNASSFQALQQPQPAAPMNPHAHGSGGGGSGMVSHGQQQGDFINQLSQNPMAGLAMNTAQDFLSKQSAIYLPGAYGFFGSAKYYFTVNNSYVKSRLKILLMPFWHRNWRRLGTDSDDGKTNQYAPPSRDINAPDLYLPLMGFLTYILIVGYTKGASNQFSPDVIGKDASYCLVMQLVEIGVMAACLYLLSSSISFLDLVSFSGYKYIPLVINTIVYQTLGSAAYYVALLYTGVAVSYFTLNCMKGSVAEPTVENRAFRNYLLFGVSCLQLVLVSWISYTTSPHE